MRLFLEKHPIIKGVVVSFAVGTLLTAIVEIISRLSFSAFVDFAFATPTIVAFLYNCCIASLMICVARLFKRRAFAYSFVAFIWIALAVINAILKTLRPSPLTASDFVTFLTAYALTTSYMKVWQIVVLIIGAVAAITALVILFRRSTVLKLNYKREVSSAVLTVAVFCLFTFVGTGTSALEIDFTDISRAYDKYGFEYCFCSTVFRRGIDKPIGYNGAVIQDILDDLDEVNSLEEVTDNGKKELPNIVYVQLESFFDPTYYTEYRAVGDVIPNFRRLKAEYPSGILQVPVFGGGTANTEFELLTGMRVAYFGGGEVPYEGVLRDMTCEAMPYNLGMYGYKSTAIHNHTGVFYARHKVYANLGFDRFVPKEYMQDLEYTRVGWEKDKVLTRYITKAIESTPERDFVFAVSVQGHGGYPKEDEGYDLPIELENDDGSEQAFSFRYYVNQLYEMDAFVGELTEAIEMLDEDTIVLFYGDHLPSFGLSTSNLDGIGVFDTEYVIYSNFDYDFGAEGETIRANRMSAEILKSIGLNNGYLTRLNMKNAESKPYRQKLINLQYDMLYGDDFSDSRYRTPTQMTFGIGENGGVAITDIVFDGERMRVNCTGSTYQSVIYINDNPVETKYEGQTVLISDSAKNLKAGDIITVCQVSDSGVVFGACEPKMFK